MSDRLDVPGLLRALDAARVEHVIIGGWAVTAHGVIRATKDIDICPDPAPQNLERLARCLTELGARQLGVDDAGFTIDEMPVDPTDPGDLAQGGNFRLETSLGVLDIMQWVPGIESASAYHELAPDAEEATAFGVTLRVCSLTDLRRMKRAAGRPQDLIDLELLDEANHRAGAG